MPLVSQVKHDPVLTNISVQFRPAQGGYLADMVAPPVPVRLETADYWVYDRSRFDTPDSHRAPRGEFNRIEWSATKKSYSCEEYGLEQPIDDRERSNAAFPLQPDIDSTEIVTDMVLNNREKRITDQCLSTKVVTKNTTLSGTAQWSDDSGSSHPLDDARVARTTMFDATGMRPNMLVIGYKVFEALKVHSDIIERFQYVTGGIVTADILKQYFEVDMLYIGGVLRRTSNEGATDAYADVWGKDALFFYSERRPALKRPSFMYTMRVRGMSAERYREDKIKSDVIRVSEIQDEHVVASDLGYLIKNAIA